jgi:hypothetical protein
LREWMGHPELLLELGLKGCAAEVDF